MTRLDALSPPPSAYSDEYTYDVLGNLKSKTGLGTYTYGVTVSSCATGTPASKPHAVAQAGSITFTYDCNGNMLSGGGRIYTWDVENRPASIAHVSGTESYTYDADGERVTKSNGTVTTFYLGGLWEEDSTGATKSYYNFNGQVVALRDATGVSYLHGDHLGSVSVATDQTGAVVSRQAFDPWGKQRGSGSISQTNLNYTGQRLDITGLLYYHARMYDPALGRFVSADSVVPGNASGGMDGVALKGLTVDFHEPGFVAGLNQENQQPFWFQMRDEERRKAGNPWGPMNPQALNRYSYVHNNPLKYIDPSGRWTLNFGFTIRVGAFLGGSFSAGVTIDGHGNIAGYTTTSHSSLDMKKDDNITVGAVVGASVGAGATNADTIYETQGSSGAIGLDGAILGDAGIDIINPQNIGKKGYVGLSGGVGIGIGADWHVELTDTKLYGAANIPEKVKSAAAQMSWDFKRNVIPPEFR